VGFVAVWVAQEGFCVGYVAVWVAQEGFCAGFVAVWVAQEGFCAGFVAVWVAQEGFFLWTHRLVLSVRSHHYSRLTSINLLPTLYQLSNWQRLPVTHLWPSLQLLLSSGASSQMPEEPNKLDLDHSLLYWITTGSALIRRHISNLSNQKCY